MRILDRISISPKQLFALIMLFEFGTALVVPIGLTSVQGIWLAILLALAGGSVLFFIYTYLYKEYPNLPFTGYAQKIVGKHLGWLIGFLYILQFIHIAARNLREAGDLLVSSIYDRTPLFAIIALMILTVMYVLNKGLEVLARLGEMYLIILIILGVIGNFLVLFSNIIEVKNLLPLLPNGWKPIITSAYPNILIFPFGELICFTMIFPYLNKPALGTKTGLMALIVSGVILSFTHALEVAVLGPDIYSRATFPLYITASKVNIADFLQRIDAIVMLSLVIGVFFKMSIYCYAAISAIADLFRIQNQQKLVVPICFIVLISAMMISSNWSEHVAEGSVDLKVFMPVFCIAIPVLLCLITWVRKRFKRG